MNKTIVAGLALLVAICLLGAYLALHDNTASELIAGTNIGQAPVVLTVEPSPETAPVAIAEPVQLAPSTATDNLALSPQRAARLAQRVDLQQSYYQHSGENFDFERMSDTEIFALLDELYLQVKNGETHAALKWLGLATAFCGKSVIYDAHINRPLDYNMAYLRRLPANETQFTKEFLLEFNAAEIAQTNARRQQCKDKTSEILTDLQSMEKFLSMNGSVLGFLASGEESLLAQVQLLGATDQSELMALPDNLRAQLVEEMLSNSETAEPCADIQSVLPYIINGAGPKIIAVQTQIAQLGCETPLLDVPEPLKQLEYAAGFGDRTVINQYLSKVRQTNADNYRIENAAWREFESVLARSYCYGNQTLNVLARYYHDQGGQHSGLSVLEATEAQSRSAELQSIYLHQAKQYLGCAL